MDQKDQKNQEKNLSQLMEFDFDDLLMDEIPGEEGSAPHKTGQSEAAGMTGRVKNANAVENEQKRIEKQEQQTQKKRKKQGWKLGFEIATWVKDLILAGVVLWILFTFVATTITMPNTSMEPELQAGEHYLISKLVYRLKGPERGDLVAFEYEDGNGKQQESVSRVIGMPGDRVEISEQGKITINGKELLTDYCKGNTTFVPGQMTYPYVVPENAYFVLSDNPAGTTDSRFSSIGAVEKDDIVGSVVFCYWPQESWRPIG